MQKTSNYNLKKPESTDPLRVADFNENADIIDAALGGGTKVVAGSYAGTGTYGANNPTMLDFTDTLGEAPAALYITAPNGSTRVFVIKGMTAQYCSATVSNQTCSVIWTETGVGLYHASSAYNQLNNEGTTYYYCAIG